MKVKLRCLSGSHAGDEITIENRSLVLGRDKACDLRLPSSSVSRRHCLIKVSTRAVTVRDLNSRNGTFVNDQRVDEECEVAERGFLKVGKFEFELLITETEKAEKKLAAVRAVASSESGDSSTNRLIAELVTDRSSSPVVLHAMNGPDKGTTIDVHGPKFVIGRSKADFRPRNDSVSRQHCELRTDEGRITVRDLKSRNGTFVNGEAVKEETNLSDGDELRVGRLDLKVKIPAAAKDVDELSQPLDALEPDLAGDGSDEIAASWADELTEELSRMEDGESSRDTMASKRTKMTLDAADLVKPPPSEEKSEVKEEDAPAEDDQSETKDVEPEKGKLPPLPEKDSVNAREAAKDAITDFFRRR